MFSRIPDFILNSPLLLVYIFDDGASSGIFISQVFVVDGLLRDIAAYVQ